MGQKLLRHNYLVLQKKMKDYFLTLTLTLLEIGQYLLRDPGLRLGFLRRGLTKAVLKFLGTMPVVSDKLEGTFPAENMCKC